MIGVAFDLDGTLIDSAPAIQAVGNRLLEEQGLYPLSVEETRSYVGDGAAKFVERAFAARRVEDRARVQQAIDLFEIYYAEADPLDNEPMPGVDRALAALSEAECRLALCTNKPGAPARSVVRALGWSEHLKAIVTGDSLPVKKPDPGPLLEARRLLGADRLIYAGDSEVDAETAQCAETPFLLYSEGYRRTPVEQLPHRAAFAHFDQLPALIETLAEEL